MELIVRTLICDRFDASPGKHQYRAEDGVGQGLLLEFSMPVDYDVESGYRYYQVLIYGQNNYVQVLARSVWNVIEASSLEWDEEAQDDFVRKGCSYTKGATEWICYGDHDSGWRDGIGRALRDAPGGLSSVRVNETPLFDLFPHFDAYNAACHTRPKPESAPVFRFR